MMISITSCQVSIEQAEKVEAFSATFLPWIMKLAALVLY
jgi:hypothetical protein